MKVIPETGRSFALNLISTFYYNKLYPKTQCVVYLNTVISMNLFQDDWGYNRNDVYIQYRSVD